VPNCATAGVLGVLPGVMGSIQATEAIDPSAGELLAGRLLVYDALDCVHEFRFGHDDCAVCRAPTITTLRDAPSCACGHSRMRQPVAELRAMLDAGTASRCAD
jgi:hypothetical protein